MNIYKYVANVFDGLSSILQTMQASVNKHEWTTCFNGRYEWYRQCLRCFSHSSKQIFQSYSFAFICLIWIQFETLHSIIIHAAKYHILVSNICVIVINCEWDPRVNSASEFSGMSFARIPWANAICEEEMAREATGNDREQP